DVIRASVSAAHRLDDVIVTPQERKEFWENNRKLFSSEGRVKLRTITIAKTADGQSQKALVDEIRGKLVEGADFASMARAYSVDSGAQNGGSRGEFGPGDLNKELADVAFSVPVQTVSQIIDLGDFYTLVYVDAREGGAVAPLSEVEDEVHRRVLQNKRQERVDRWLKTLRRDANIKIIG
ncbi:MAG: peptidylprolyl isomerase, partial [Verrucomicrobiota bacterium]